jgi:16S rRNA (cytidine1402-2'-O)-methyltransferase
MQGTLYLIPSTIGETKTDRVIPHYVKEVVAGIRHYIVEEERTARRMLIKLEIPFAIDDLVFYTLNKHTDKSKIPDYLKVAETEDIGLLTEAGVPAIADPGSEIVSLAHLQKIKVVPLVGPSSILLAMMASGLNGQNFAFNGYLPVKNPERIKKIRQLEMRSQEEDQSQIFIEAPYRNNQLLADILSACSDQTLLCLAANLSSENEFIITQTISQWIKEKPDLHKIPAIFILHKKNKTISR